MTGAIFILFVLPCLIIFAAFILHRLTKEKNG